MVETTRTGKNLWTFISPIGPKRLMSFYGKVLMATFVWLAETYCWNFVVFYHFWQFSISYLFFPNKFQMICSKFLVRFGIIVSICRCQYHRKGPIWQGTRPPHLIRFFGNKIESELLCKIALREQNSFDMHNPVQ